MSELGGLHSTLQTLSFVELVLAFAAVLGYAMALNASFSARIRSFAALLALVAAAAFAASMTQWIEGVMLMALVVAAMGVFVGIVWALSAICGLTGRVSAESVSLPAPLASDSMPAEPGTPLALHRHGSHVHSA